MQVAVRILVTDALTERVATRLALNPYEEVGSPRLEHRAVDSTTLLAIQVFRRLRRTWLNGMLRSAVGSAGARAVAH